MAIPLWRKLLAKRFVRRVNRLISCVSCGKQPIEWHREEHVKKPTWRIGSLAVGGYSLDRIKAEMRLSTPFCRSCHMIEDGRMKALHMATRPPVKPPVPCTECGKLAKPTRKGLCAACYMRGYNNPERRPINSVKTHCPRGHEYTPANTRMSKGSRNCRKCQREGYQSRK